MNALITMVKGQQVKDHKGQNRACSDRIINNEDRGGRNLSGPDSNASGPFRNGSSPIQCYSCWGWGHRASECPSHLNYKRMEGPKSRTNIPSPPPQTTCEQRAEQPKPRNNPKAKPTVRTIHDRYHNLDPIVRLIGKGNESKIIVDGKEYPGLLDAGVQMSTITIR